jgi:hypothetical protein
LDILPDNDPGAWEKMSDLCFSESDDFAQDVFDRAANILVQQTSGTLPKSASKRAMFPDEKGEVAFHVQPLTERDDSYFPSDLNNESYSGRMLTNDSQMIISLIDKTLPKYSNVIDKIPTPIGATPNDSRGLDIEYRLYGLSADKQVELKDWLDQVTNQDAVILTGYTQVLANDITASITEEPEITATLQED